MMARRSLGALLLLAMIVGSPLPAMAGGTEFPADGTRNLGRGGAGMARADDASVMIRNPALLADLWDDSALLGANLLLVDACFQATGGYGLNITTPDGIRLGDQLLATRVPATMLADGTPLVDITAEPYPEVCYQGPTPFLPHVALTMKPTSDLGVGIGFFPPDNAALNQFGNRDGTVDTPNGLRPSPLGSIRSHLNTSYFSVLGAVGYRVNDWIRVGLGFQWQLVVFQSRSFVPAYNLSGLKASGLVRTDVWGRDLFIPAVVASVHVKPIDALDVAFGFKWSDRVQSKAKLDLTSGAYGIGERVDFFNERSGMLRPLASTVPTLSANQGADVNAPPISVPQISFGVRYADRLKPMIKDADWKAAKAASGRVTEDSMQNERWDIELDVIYYMTSFIDRTEVNFSNAQAEFRAVQEDGVITERTAFDIGDCFEMGADGRCVRRVAFTEARGKDQITARLGGDYNILPGLFTIRAGGSYEADGQDAQWRTPFQYFSNRIGLHAGFTVRLAGKTDFSFGFAHFIQQSLRLQVNPASAVSYDNYVAANGGDPARYHYAPGEALDGTAGVEIANPNAVYPERGPFYANAGSQFYDLSVLSASISQRF
jgi:long-subunit fatty acid transport protein